MISAESCAAPRVEEGGDPAAVTIPEELAKEAVFKLLDEIYKVRGKSPSSFSEDRAIGLFRQVLWTRLDKR